MERTLNDDLSGDEIVKALLEKIETALRKDCYLNNTTAYREFSAKVVIEVQCFDVPGVREIKRELTLVSSPPPPVDDPAARVEIDLEPAPPNVVRQDTGQPISVLTTDEKGKKTIVKKKYARAKEKVEA